MVAPAARTVEKFLSAPPHKIDGFLIYGSDAQQGAARAASLCQRIAERSKPPSDVVRLHEADMASDPDRIIIELETRPLFGGRKVIWATGLPPKVQSAIIEAVSRGDLPAALILHAPDIKRTHKITQIFEAADHLAAVPCYGEDEANLSHSLRQFASSLGYELDHEAADLVAARSDFSVLVARSEIEKLATYAGEEKKITLDDVELCLVDQRTAGAAESVDAALSGDGRAAMVSFQRLFGSEGNVVPVLMSLSSSLQRLHAIRAAVDQGRPAKDAIAGFRPPIFFKQQQAVASQMSLWSTSALETALARTNAIIQETRLKPQLAEALTADLLLAIARNARKGRNVR